ncbi:MAG: hypothetical protein LIP03_13560 [Bacteroidales bacterium]|nr:hypothetical protein [Bacteroidales bacterium]
MSDDKIPPGSNREAESIGGLLEAASDEAGRILRAIQEIAGTTSCKGVQIAGLKKWAQANNCWIPNPDILGGYSDRGSENEVYVQPSTDTVYKLNDFRYADDNLTSFFERIRIHNSLFSGCPYDLIGFSENREGKVCAVLSQPFIRADREASIEEIAGALVLMGFMPMDEGEYFSDGKIDIFDALPNNVLHGKDGQLYFIDTILSPSSDEYLDTYKTKSPNWRKSQE